MVFRNKTATILAAGALGSSMLSGCAADGTLDMNRAIGTGLGAAAGLAVCSVTGANDTECALAVLAGAAAGYVIADRINPEDKPQRDATVATVLADEQIAVGQTTSYEVADTGSEGEVTLLALTTNSDGWQCKQLEEDYNPANADGISETYTMCQNPQTGEWENA
ncbi:MAG: hypothetical protein AAFR41_04955 [Pseudomonadota bacterium]